MQFAPVKAARWRAMRLPTALLLPLVRAAANCDRSPTPIYVDDMLEASDTPEAAACVERHVAWRKRRRVQQDGQLYYGTGAGCEDDA